MTEKTWDDYIKWCKENNRKPSDGKALVEYVKGS